jgi:hypothetical protein
VKLNEQKIPIGFWSIALIAAALVLLVSVAAGRLVGTELLRHGIAPVAQPPTLTGPLPPEVVGGQLHAIAVPGQSAPIWTKPPKSEQANPVRSTESQPVEPVAPVAQPAATSAPPVPKQPSHAKIMTSMVQPKRSLPVVRVVVQRVAEAVAPAPAVPSAPLSTPATTRPTLVPIAQITPAGDNLGF